MKLLLSYRLLLSMLFIFAGTIAAAQDEATSKFIDSLKRPPLLNDSFMVKYDSAADTEESIDSADAEISPDTAITSNLRQINKDTIALIKKDKGFYYQQWLDSILRAEEGKDKVKIVKEPRKPDLPDLSVFFTVFQTVLWILAVGILIFVLYKLFLGKSALFLKNRKNIDTVINIEEEEVPAGRYENLIKKAEAENNYRLAVRYLHLQTLFNLSEKGYIQLATEKTNYQYINELRKGPPAIVNLFSALTSKYEYIWYGEYPVTNTMYYSLRNEFTAFNKKIVSD